MPSKKQLVIVESPAKAKTIEKYLGPDYQVMSSFGHIRDLPKKGLNIDIKHNFEPTYAISPDKLKVVSNLKKAAAKSSQVWLASDEDREGEAIAWHLCIALGLNPKTTKRIVFHEITEPAIAAALKNPRTVDIRLVDAQQARRVLDRLVGYELSPVLWKKIRTGLSAGRVQSVAVRLIVEREREIKKFAVEQSYKVTANFKAKGHDLPAELPDKLKTKALAQKFLEAAKASTFAIKDITKKPGTRSAAPPFTTSTLQQEAARKLGFSVRQTMTIAQHLYEDGEITYMRTDSLFMSDLALAAANKYVVEQFGGKYSKRQQYKTKTLGAQEAHEAIRPTNFTKTGVSGDAGAQKLYKLIWQRALASQMADAKVGRTDITISMSKHKDTLVAKGEVLEFDGFFKVYGGGKDDVILPDVAVGQKLDLESMTATETYNRAPARYSEASLVRRLEELEIGRPSTYAPTIGTIQTRGYVERSDVEGTEQQIAVLTLKGNKIQETEEKIIVGADRNKLLPTSIADVTIDFLVDYFEDVLDYNFTADVEKDFDRIAEGEEVWNVMIKKFYKTFHPLIGISEKASREEVAQARKVGKDPKSGELIIARYGRYGPMLQKGEATEDKKPDFAPLPEGVKMEDVTLSQALEMFKLPRTVGKTDKDEPILANIGRFGPYIQVGKLYVSLKEDDPMSITEVKARKLYKAKLDQIAHKYIKEFKGGVKIVNGPYGPYVTNGKKNAKIPEETDPKTLTEAASKKLLANAKPGRRFPRRQKTT